jgi:NADH-quinone oxidoreductase subunit I
MATTSPPGIGLLKGLGVTVKNLFRAPTTQMYPKERPDLPPRTRGVIALMDENCTVCMLCARECPDWCIYIDSHKETVPPAKEGGRARTRNVLDRFAIDFSLCMYCGICVEVCPFDALWWSPEFEYSEFTIGGMLHEMERLREWADTVVPPPALDEGAVLPAEVADAIQKAEKERELAAAKQQEAAQQAEQATAPAAAPAATGEPAAAAPKAAEIHVEAGQIDQETFDKLIAEGKSERMARAKAKAAYVKKEKARLAAEAAGGADAAASDAGASTAADPAPEAAPEDAAPAKKLGDVHVEGAGEIDQEVFDRLIAEGKSERIARAKAKAAWVKKRKQELLDEEGQA